MPLRMTNMQSEAHDAFEDSFASAGALAFVNEYQSLPRYRLSIMPSQNAGRHELGTTVPDAGRTPMKSRPPQPLRPLLASTGLMRNTMSASKPLAPNNVSF